MRKSIVTVLGPTNPVHDLTTVEEVNAALGLDSNTADDAITAEQITNASRIIADQCNAGPDRLRTFGLLTIEESFRIDLGEPIHALYLRQYPIGQISSITQDGSEADANLYEIDDEAGLLWMKCGRWCGEIVVNYSGGYDLPTEAPPLLAQACIDGRRHNVCLPPSAAADPNVREVQHGDTRVVFQTWHSAAAAWRQRIGAVKRFRLIDRYIRRAV